MRRIILASASPRRRELLSRFVTGFDIIPADIDETIFDNESPSDYVRRMAVEKRDKIAASNPDGLIIAADTSVVCGGKIFGKPESLAHTRDILKELRKKEHCVITGVACSDVQSGTVFDFNTESFVLFDDYSDDVIEKYAATGEPNDKAGAYAIQGIGSILVKSIRGDYDNIVGLPIAEVVRRFASYGIFLF